MFGFVWKMRLRKILMVLGLGYGILYAIQVFSKSTSHPILLWWTPYNIYDRTIECNKYSCVVSGNHEFKSHENLKFLLFYGSDVNESLPSRNKIPWAIYHEESPKNLPIFLNKKIQSLFDITATFSRHSQFPVTLQYLENLDLITTTKYFKTTKKKNDLLKELAPILYIQTDCDTPIDRDSYVKKLMEFVDVDSYGACLNNKKLPQKFVLNGTYDLYEEEFMHFVSQYKFVIAVENARCYDYITEKLWRPLIVGSVPIYLGSPSIKDWLPNNNSAILIEDYSTIKSLSDYIKLINKNDTLYETFLRHKTEKLITNKLLISSFDKGTNGIENYNYNPGLIIPAFECFVCENVHTNEYLDWKVNENVYECDDPQGDKNVWAGAWNYAKEQSKEIIMKYFD